MKDEQVTQLRIDLRESFTLSVNRVVARYTSDLNRLVKTALIDDLREYLQKHKWKDDNNSDTAHEHIRVDYLEEELKRMLEK